MVLRRWLIGAAFLAVLHPVAGGAAPVSMLEPAGVDAQPVADFFWWMAATAALTWLAALGVLGYCLRAVPARTTCVPVSGRGRAQGAGTAAAARADCDAM